MTTGIILLALAFLLLAAEVFVPSFGILGITGVIALVVGADIVIESAGPNAPIDWWTVSGVLVVIIAYFGISAGVVYRALLAKKRYAGIESLMGEEAEIVEWSDREGLVSVQGELWQAFSERRYPDLASGQTVQISGHHNLKLQIRLSE